MARADRADAMWLAENWDSLSHGDTTLTHPRRIREEHREASEPLSPEDTTLDSLLVNAAKVSGKERSILAKAEHAKADTPEGKTAKRMLGKQAASTSCRSRNIAQHGA